MSLPIKLFSYMFRPVIFEASNVSALAAAIDNLILFYVFVRHGAVLFRKRKRIYQENRVFLWTYSLSAWLVLAMTTANLGIALRQKWMFVPMLIYLFISASGRARVQPANLQHLPLNNASLRGFALDRVKPR